jgi:hypothetical protein
MVSLTLASRLPGIFRTASCAGDACVVRAACPRSNPRCPDGAPPPWRDRALRPAPFPCRRPRVSLQAAARPHAGASYCSGRAWTLQRWGLTLRCVCASWELAHALHVIACRVEGALLGREQRLRTSLGPGASMWPGGCDVGRALVPCSAATAAALPASSARLNLLPPAPQVYWPDDATWWAATVLSCDVPSRHLQLLYSNLQARCCLRPPPPPATPSHACSHRPAQHRPPTQAVRARDARSCMRTAARHARAL